MIIVETHFSINSKLNTLKPQGKKGKDVKGI